MRVTKFIAVVSIALLLGACEKEKISIDSLDAAPTSVVTTTSADMSTSFLVISKSNKLPNGLEIDLAKAGGSLESSIPEVGIAVASSGDPDFANRAAKIEGIGDVVPNLRMQFIDPRMNMELVVDDAASPPFTGDDDFYFDYQWGHTAIMATDAWEEGFKGAGARVGVLDTGFDLDHPDLVPNINMDLSQDFTGDGLQYTLPDVFSHGTHTAGTIAAADNAFGTIGVAPEAELVLIKVLSDEGSGWSSDIMAGIVYAADMECDVINMSIGSTFYMSGNGPNTKLYAAYKNAYNKVITYAYQNGTTVIASAGNDALDFDHAGSLMHMPSDASHAISISATGPRGWAYDFFTNLDEFASYSNYGKSAIDFAAPGGDHTLYPNGLWHWDMVLSTGNGGWFWSAGTSMAAPHAAGVAALIIGKNGGQMEPAQVESVLRASADDLGKLGVDEFYGKGRVNAHRAVKN